MKINNVLALVVSFVLLSLQTVLIAQPRAVAHSHAGRTHQHPLPQQGVSHRHGNGVRGVIATRRNQSRVIRHTINYFSTSNSNQVAQSPSTRPQTVQHSSQNNTGKQGMRASQNYAKADVTCRVGEADCNVCASNVQQQFQKAVAGQISWRSKPWRFTWAKSYPPFNKRPLDIFDGDPAYALGIPDKHVQGFVRTNSARFPYAGSHSHKRQGGIFVIRQTGDGKKYLSSLQPTRTKHPSAVHILGKYLVYGEKNTLFFKDLNSPDQKRTIQLSIRSANFGGGLGVLRLSKDNYLLVTTGPGGQDKRPRVNRFYHLRGVNGVPKSLTYITESRVTKPAKWPRALGFSENLSLISECGTGDIYAIHTTGDEKGISAINGNGYWRLSKMVNNYGSYDFKSINAMTTRQNMSSCNVRAAATVFVNSRHGLEFYCHGYAKDPDGSTFNVLGSSSRNKDKFHFKVGVVR